MPDQTSEIAALAAILTTDYTALSGAGMTMDGFVTVAEEIIKYKRWHEVWQTVTRGPSGQHYAWEWQGGLTEMQEAIGPAEYGEPTITPVHAVEETVVVTKWVRDA